MKIRVRATFVRTSLLLGATALVLGACYHHHGHGHGKKHHHGDYGYGHHYSSGKRHH
jgi:hypothetical protein